MAGKSENKFVTLMFKKSVQQIGKFYFSMIILSASEVVLKLVFPDISHESVN